MRFALGVVVVVLWLISIQGGEHGRQTEYGIEQHMDRGVFAVRSNNRLARSLEGVFPHPEPAEVAVTPPEAPAVQSASPESTDGAGVSVQGEAMAPVASSVVQAPNIVLTNDIERLVCSYSWDCWTALHVMWCESGGKPDTWVPWTHTANPYDGVAGLFQLAIPLHSALIGGDPFDPATNIDAAYRLWQGSGWRPWACA